MAYFQQLQIYNDGTTLKDHVSKETYKKLQKITTKLNLPANTFDTIKPWAITTSLSLLSFLKSPDELSQASTLGVDMYLITSAILSGKPVHELEGMKFQGDLLSNVAPEQQEKELNQILDALLDESSDDINLPEEFRKAQLQWAKGDLNAFSKSFLISDSVSDNPESQRLLGDRDKNMANKLADLLEAEGKSTHFVVIGAAHFVTKDMVLDQLKKKGYTVEFIK
ncbi:TraB family protein [Fontibacillus panacisegetis]|uniref:TraB family protein n=2 Tax=Fontibacillus panacisegetis TaxID=670482 RepID=A0A1G7G4Q7_9BACL|nr:TraB family protein [Fontibacillus panacisegetis]